MKRILLIAYHFPPDSAVGALRPLKFAKYLPAYGWEPYILTVKPSYYEGLDASRLEEVPTPSRVFRTAMLPHPNTVYKDVKKSLYTAIGRKQEFRRTLLTPSSAPGPARRRFANIRGFLGSLLWIPPDDVLGWLPVAVLKGISLLRAHRITHIYTT